MFTCIRAEYSIIHVALKVNLDHFRGDLEAASEPNLLSLCIMDTIAENHDLCWCLVIVRPSASRKGVMRNVTSRAVGGVKPYDKSP